MLITGGKIKFEYVLASLQHENYISIIGYVVIIWKHFARKLKFYFMVQRTSNNNIKESCSNCKYFMVWHDVIEFC